jgi:hypothetical protein
MSLVFARVARVATRSFVAKTGFQAMSTTTKYSKSHEYVKVLFYYLVINDVILFNEYQIVGDIGIVGITDHAAGALGDVVYVDLPAIGSKYSAGDSFGSVESVKAASDVYSPVSGEVVEVNTVCEMLNILFTLLMNHQQF